MISLELDLVRMLNEARLDRIPVETLDLGYLVHCTLCSLFGENAPQPFALGNTQGRRLRVLGYCDSDRDALRGAACAAATPTLFECCHWESLAVKPMPERWLAQERFQFEVRGCPVLRAAADSANHRKGAEVDLFLAECWKQESPRVPVDREEVYRRWLAKELQRGNASALLSARMVSFRQPRLIRRRQGDVRSARPVQRPDAAFRGILQVCDPAAFAALVRRGIGRHRAFGFGMLLLRRVKNPC
jgi:CRISPR system Cascade subunit CasE